MRQYIINGLLLNVEIEYKPRNKKIYIKAKKPNKVIIRTLIKLADAKINDYLYD